MGILRPTISAQDALRGLLQRYTATELFRCTASSAEGPASAATAGTVGMDDLDELLLRSEVTLPLEVVGGGCSLGRLGAEVGSWSEFGSFCMILLNFKGFVPGLRWNFGLRLIGEFPFSRLLTMLDNCQWGFG